MPGILPMKVIKVGPSSQARIAQACDRCRSKKIRCDGVRPCCTQCSSVGFECKTSDKLSRRAFPRGYTESLEERVRALEAEVRELKDLLDEKDEKIDMLSKMHSNRQPSMSLSPGQSVAESKKDETSSPPKEDVFRVQASPLLLDAENADSYFVGASSGRAFVDAFKRKIQETGKSIADLNLDTFLTAQSGEYSTSPPAAITSESTAPPRMFSDRCVNIFFQEWSPLFPVLHKPSFLRLYEEYVSNPEEVTDDHKLAQLHLVFDIAGTSSSIPEPHSIASCEQQWRSSLEAILMDNTIVTLQCLVLALVHCILKGDYTRLQHYKGIAIGLSHRLGLHQSQKRFSLGALTIETRKKVFWTLYTIDCFSAALLGQPKLLKESDVHTEYPSDTDDEYVTEKGFLPTLPGEFTKISSALALFRATRILSKVLEQNYPAAATHDLSLQSLSSLDDELKEWSDSLPTHLKLTFVQDKPSTDVTGNRSALLSLAYYYIRSLVHRPAVGSTLGQKSSPSVITLAESSKHIIQILQLLEERSMSFSFCVNKNEMLVLCGLSLLYQGLDLKQDGKLMLDSQRLVLTVVQMLERAEAPGAREFRKLASVLIKLDKQKEVPIPVRKQVIKSTTPVSPQVSNQQARPSMYRMPSCSISESELLDQQEKLRRATMPNIATTQRVAHNTGRRSMDGQRPESPVFRREQRSSVPLLSQIRPRPRNGENQLPIDYVSISPTIVTQPRSASRTRSQLPLSSTSQTPVFPTPAYSAPKTYGISPSEWESLLGSLDGGQTNLYDAIYGGPALSLPETTQSNFGDWSPDGRWDMRNLTSDLSNHASGTTQSVLSFSDESLTSGEDLATSDLGLGMNSLDFTNPLLAAIGITNDYFLDGLDETFGL